MDTLLRRRELIEAVNSAPAPIFHAKLIFDGTAYIDTTVLMPEDGTLRAIFGWETEKKYQVLFSFDGKVGTYLNSSTNATSRYFTATYDGATGVSGTTLSLGWSYSSYSFFLSPSRVGYGSTTRTFTKGSSHPTSGLVVGQNASHSGTPFTGGVQRIRIYGSDAKNVTSNSDLDNYTPVANLRPCTYLGEAGLWWVEQGIFFGNSAGSGSLSVAD